jgi:hypothetical protein
MKRASNKWKWGSKGKSGWQSQLLCVAFYVWLTSHNPRLFKSLLVLVSCMILCGFPRSFHDLDIVPFANKDLLKISWLSGSTLSIWEPDRYKPRSTFWFKRTVGLFCWRRWLEDRKLFEVTVVDHPKNESLFNLSIFIYVYSSVPNFLEIQTHYF